MCRSTELTTKPDAKGSPADALPSPVEKAQMPWRSIAILITCNLCEPIVMAVLFPMAPYFVADQVPADEVGTWAGLLTSAYNAASIPASVFWGRLSDRVGRKPIIVVLLCGTCVSMIAFGFSATLAQALVARCLGGLFSGVGGLVMASIRDVTTPAQRSVAVSFIAWAYGAGFVVGPMIGASLSRPAQSLPFLRDSLFDAFPYLLPCVVVALLIALSGVSLWWLPDASARDLAARTAATSTTAAAQGHATASEAAAEAAPAAPEGDGRRLLSGGVSSSSGTEGMVDVPLGAEARRGRARPCGLLTALRGCAGQPILLLLCGYLFLNFGSFGSSELYPLFAARNDTSGLRLTPQQLGATMVPQGCVVMVMPFLYPRLSRRVGDTGVFYVGVTSVLAFSLFLPMLRWLPPDAPARWLLLLLGTAWRGTSGPLVFPAMLLLMNAAISERSGFWNGLAQSVASFARALAPTIFGYLFAISAARAHAAFPLDVSLPFLVAVLSLALAVLCVAFARPRAPEERSTARFVAPVRALRRVHIASGRAGRAGPE